MDIRFSRYNLPFVEPFQPGVYFIPLDYRFDCESGCHYGHIVAYREYLDSISVTAPFLPMVSSPKIIMFEEDYLNLDSLYFDSGIKAAGRRSGRNSVNSSDRYGSRQRFGGF